MGKSNWYDMREFLEFLEKKNDLLRIKEEVDPDWEVNGISRVNLQEYGPCLYFEKTVLGIQESHQRDFSFAKEFFRKCHVFLSCF